MQIDTRNISRRTSAVLYLNSGHLTKEEREAIEASFNSRGQNRISIFGRDYVASSIRKSRHVFNESIEINLMTPPAPQVPAEPAENKLIAQNWKIRHIKPKDYKCGVHAACTIMYRKIDDKTYEYKYAICSTKDMFSRKIGRAVASEREPITAFIPTNDKSTDNIVVHQILMLISLQVKVGWQFRKLANKFQVEKV